MIIEIDGIKWEASWFNDIDFNKLHYITFGYKGVVGLWRQMSSTYRDAHEIVGNIEFTLVYGSSTEGDRRKGHYRTGLMLIKGSEIKNRLCNGLIAGMKVEPKYFEIVSLLTKEKPELKEVIFKNIFYKGD